MTEDVGARDETLDRNNRTFRTNIEEEDERVFPPLAALLLVAVSRAGDDVMGQHQLMPPVPTAGMTRLVRSRTHSASSVGSTDGVRSRSTTGTLPEGAHSSSPEHTAAHAIQMTA
eukprot:superscaffoldBa00006992_g22122